MLGDKEHPETQISMNSMANLFKSRGRYDEAEHLLKECLSARHEKLGDKRESTDPATDGCYS